MRTHASKTRTPSSMDAAMDALHAAIAGGDREWRRLVRDGEEVERRAEAARTLLRSRGFLGKGAHDGH